jgi:hypothetical protein
MVSEVFLPKLLNGSCARFVRADGLNDFIVRLTGLEERTVSRELWCSLIEIDPVLPLAACGDRCTASASASRSETA